MSKAIAFIAIFTFSTLIGFAQNYKPVENIDAFLKLYKEKAKSISSLRSKFVQEKTISFLEKKLVSEGTFCYKTPSQLRMEYIKPYTYLFILSNDKVIIRSNKKETNIPTSSNPIFKTISQITIDCVSGNVLNNKEFKSSILENTSSYQITLVPKSNAIESVMSQIKVIVSKQDYTVETVEMLENSGDATLITFKEKEINKPIPDALFTGN